MENHYIGGAFAANDSEAFRLDSPSDTVWFLPKNDLNVSGFETGCDALAWLLKKAGHTTVYFPLHYCQETIDRMLLKAPEMQIERYTDIQEISSETATVVWNHFNGYCPVPEQLLHTKHFILEDCVQSLTTMQRIVGHAAVTSLRKWLEIDLAVVVSPFEQDSIGETSAYHRLKKEAEALKAEWKAGKISDESVFLSRFAAAESALIDTTIYGKDCAELYRYDWQKIIERRQENARTLKMASNPSGITLLENSDLVVMISLGNRDELRSYLFQNGIFAPVHWLDSADLGKAKSLLSLPIDQRYTTADMKRLLTAIQHGAAASDLHTKND